MFHYVNQERIDFRSNPPLSPIPHVKRDINSNGDPVNIFVMVDRDNQSPFKGSHYDPSRHSLRAMLNLGIDLKPVSYGIVNNDLNEMYAIAKHESQSLIDVSNERLSNFNDTIVESDKS